MPTHLMLTKLIYFGRQIAYTVHNLHMNEWTVAIAFLLTHNTYIAQEMGRRVSRQVANRWLVAYTLLRNESIRELTASRLSEKRAREAQKAELKKRELDGKQKVITKGDEELEVTSVTIETTEQSKQSVDSFPEQQGSQNDTGSSDHRENMTQM